jgi:hypothetical protein
VQAPAAAMKRTLCVSEFSIFDEESVHGAGRSILEMYAHLFYISSL